MRESNSVALVAQALRQELGRLAHGDRLPSVRALMARFRVSPVTVRNAMARLASEGLLEPRPGHGTFASGQSKVDPAIGDFGWQGLALGPARLSSGGLEALLAPPQPGAVNLAGGYPAPDLQATGLVAQMMVRAARRPGVWGRMPLEGLSELRAWFAQQLGAPVSPHEIVISPGSQSAIATAFAALAAPGAPVLMESPSYLGAIVAAQAAGLRLVPVPTDGAGVRPEMLAQAFATSRARLLYLQPTYANPTGATLSSERRQQVLDVVAHARAIVIEDDWCRDLSFERLPPRPLMCADRNGHVVYLRSLTKSAAPGLRIGAIAARGAALSRLAASRGIADFFVPGPLQEAALQLVHSPAWQRHLRGLRAALRSRRDVLAAAVRHHFGAESLAVMPGGGMHLWVRLPDHVDDVKLASRAADEKVLITPGRRWFPADPTGTFVRLSCAGSAEGTLERAVAIVARLAEPAANRGNAAIRRPAPLTSRRTGH